MSLSFVTTADGSKTIYNAEVGENYHSANGALQESEHVFVNSGLKHFLQGTGAGRVSILEVGFGTGLNFLLSAQFCKANRIPLDYTGIEALPLSAEMISQTGYHNYVNAYLWDRFVFRYPTSLLQSVQLTPLCSLHVAHSKLMDFRSKKKI